MAEYAALTLVGLGVEMGAALTLAVWAATQVVPPFVQRAVWRYRRWRRRHEPPLFVERWATGSLQAQQQASTLAVLVDRQYARTTGTTTGTVLHIPHRTIPKAQTQQTQQEDSPWR